MFNISFYIKYILKCLLALRCRMQTFHWIKSNQIFYYCDSMIQQQQEISTYFPEQRDLFSKYKHFIS